MGAPSVRVARVGTPRRQPGLWRSMMTLSLVRLSLVLFGLGRTVRLISRLDRRRLAGTPCDAASARSIEASVAKAAALFPGRALCLEQSLTLYALLRRSSVSARLRLGVQPYPFAAHAWVEADGEPLNDIAEHVAFYVPLEDLLP
ncbi:MAG TPA: lasso peptide biosynthesis B2 protein [Gemmatimonadaceae bacterium]|nr:lasso peptide biosynthesis B2 protein [Gemmatimonadaceae bacterium]